MWDDLSYEDNEMYRITKSYKYICEKCGLECLIHRKHDCVLEGED